jgi:tRNA(Ile)-lysidine synthase
METGAPPLTFSEFEMSMARFAPFETSPRIAVAVSGGADSMALVLLAERWARARGGQIDALTVDHGLRPESAAEARQTGVWLAARGIRHHVLRWTGAKPRTGIQAAARDARYRLLGGWCQDQGVLHLLVAHHRADQAETYVLRRARGSGPDGLAAMAPVTERAEMRLLRPFLDVAPERLRATLRQTGQAWIEDPTNRDPRFARARLRSHAARHMQPARQFPEVSRRAMAAAARRAAAERETAALFAHCCRLAPAGYARLDRNTMRRLSPDFAARALARVIACVGGRAHVPASRKLERLVAGLASGNDRYDRTLGGCRILARPDDLLVCRENRNLPAPTPVSSGDALFWDGRFRVAIGDVPDGTVLGSLGEEGWRQISADAPGLRDSRIPLPARLSSPALWDAQGVFAVPHLRYDRNGNTSWGIGVHQLFWAPMIGLTASARSVASPEFQTISVASGRFAILESNVDPRSTGQGGALATPIV